MTENEFADLPDDPAEGFAFLEKRLRRAIEVAISSELSALDSMRDYIISLCVYNETHELDYFDSPYWERKLDTSNDTQAVYINFCRATKRIATRNLIQAAKDQKERPYTVIKIEAEQKSEIRRLVEKIKTKIEVMELDVRRKESLLQKLNIFAREVDFDRTRTEAFFAFIVEASQVAKEAGENIKPFQNTIDRLVEIIDKTANKITTAFPHWKAPKQLEGPKPEEQVETDN